MPDTQRILIVDDEKAIRQSLEEIFHDEGYEVVCAATFDEGLAGISENIDLAIVDIKLDGEATGIDLLTEFKRRLPLIPVIIISGHGTVGLTAEAFKRGAYDFMEKPLRLIQVRTCVRNALETISLKHRISEQERSSHPRPVIESAPMRDLYRQVNRLASLPQPVIILGPTGSGKELVARALHDAGKRSHGPFIATNAASLPHNLAEDELFGHEKGAFTGAHARRPGCIEQADGGTLFLDEIADMDTAIQPKLLRVLETNSFRRLGGTESISVNVRVVAATHADMESRVVQKTFRKDLWYRLAAFVLRVPPLSERREDIPVLSETFLRDVCRDMQIIRTLSPEALTFLAGLDYPGNIRELKHIITRTAAFSAGTIIEPADIRATAPAGLAEKDDPLSPVKPGLDQYLHYSFREARLAFERDFLRTMLKRHDNNITATAAAIGMAQSNLSRKMKELENAFPGC